MKRKERTHEDCSTRWSKEEIDVALLLRTLPRCPTWFLTGQLPNNIPTRKRSPIQTRPQIPVTVAVAVTAAAVQGLPCNPIVASIQNRSFPSSSPPQPAAVIATVVAPPCNPVVKEHAASPNTPLSFPVTESDEKTEPSRKKSSLKRKKEYYLNVIEGLTNTKASLTQELQNLKSHYEELMDINLKLKAKEEEIINGPKSDHKIPNLEIHEVVQLGQVNVSNKSLKSTAKNEAHNGEDVAQLNPTTLLLMETNVENNQGPLLIPDMNISIEESNVDSNQGPLLFPDLSMSIEESSHVESCQPLDACKAIKDQIKVIAAQARQRRLQILRLKKSSGNTSKPPHSHS